VPSYCGGCWCCRRPDGSSGSALLLCGAGSEPPLRGGGLQSRACGGGWGISWRVQYAAVQDLTATATRTARGCNACRAKAVTAAASSACRACGDSMSALCLTRLAVCNEVNKPSTACAVLLYLQCVRFCSFVVLQKTSAGRGPRPHWHTGHTHPHITYHSTKNSTKT
jgi:hypothetical protein